MHQSLNWFGRSSSCVGLSLAWLLVGCAGESLTAEDEISGQRQEAAVVEAACEGVSARPPAAGRYKVVRVKAGTDTMLKKAQPDTSFRDDTHCFASFDDQEVCLVRFPVDLPQTAQIHFAQLSLNNRRAPAAKFSAYTMDARWSEFGATWNRYTSVSKWTVPGASSDTRESFCVFTSASGRVNYNLSGWAVAQIQDWVSGHAENSGIGFFTDVESAGTWLDLSSSEGPVEDVPELILWYSDAPIASQKITFSAQASTTISMASPTSNFANDAACNVLRSSEAGERSCLLRWDFTSIAPGSLVTRVEFGFAPPASAESRYGLFLLRRAWMEQHVTWRVFATGNLWEKPGAYGPSDVNGLAGSWLANQWQPSDVTFRTVQRWINNSSQNFGALVGPWRAPATLAARPWVLPADPTVTITFTPP